MKFSFLDTYFEIHSHIFNFSVFSPLLAAKEPQKNAGLQSAQMMCFCCIVEDEHIRWLVFSVMVMCWNCILHYLLFLQSVWLSVYLLYFANLVLTRFSYAYLTHWFWSLSNIYWHVLFCLRLHFIPSLHPRFSTACILPFHFLASRYVNFYVTAYYIHAHLFITVAGLFNFLLLIFVSLFRPYIII